MLNSISSARSLEKPAKVVRILNSLLNGGAENQEREDAALNDEANHANLPVGELRAELRRLKEENNALRTLVSDIDSCPLGYEIARRLRLNSINRGPLGGP